MEETKQTQHVRVIAKEGSDSKKYETDYSFKPWDGNDPMGVHTTTELLHCLEKKKDVELDARVIGVKEGQWVTQALPQKKFIESFRKSKWDKVKFRESDFFATDNLNFGGSIGQDFTPLLGGPFYKNLYYYQDYIRMHADAFFAYHNDPFARAITEITNNFVLGTGYEMAADDNDEVSKVAMAAWKAFEEANDFQHQIEQFGNELSIYGESMFWKLPAQQTKITFDLGLGDKPPTGIIPRVRLIDPSNIVEIVTYPEDITRPLFYVWLTPTQYQIYTSGLDSTEDDSKALQPTLKFIYRTIPAEQMMHFKVNAVSNEKRGRSDYFPIFQYLKRMRDAVEYSMVSLQKVAAWSIDTTIDGDQTDVDNYVQNQSSIGTIAPAGSEFAHTKGIKREYLGNAHAGGHSSDVFQWNASMIAAGSGIPLSWFGLHLSGGQTRASALVSTEPVAKKMEKRREVVKRCLRMTWNYVMKCAGLPMVDVNILFPELITQDRSQKLKDLVLAEQARWFKPERAAGIAAKEFHITNYSYAEELKDMTQELKEIPMPLTSPGTDPSAMAGEPGTNNLASTDKGEIKNGDREF